MNDPLVSVCLITYNHGRFIKETIDSVLMQNTSFLFKLIIADDFSTDGTRETILKYKNKYPELIELILQPKNVGAARNWLDLMNAPKSKYIAYLEGDDYWTDPYKLQKQVDFLEKNESYVGNFHNVEIRYEESGKASVLHCRLPGEKDITFKDLSYVNVIPSCSVVFRGKYLRDMPPWFAALPLGDWPLHLWNAQYGNFWYISHVMGVYRITSSSTWALQNCKRNIQAVIETYDKMINGFSYAPVLVSQLKKARIRYLCRNKYPISKFLYRIIRRIFIRNG